MLIHELLSDINSNLCLDHLNIKAPRGGVGTGAGKAAGDGARYNAWWNLLEIRELPPKKLQMMQSPNFDIRQWGVVAVMAMSWI